MGNNIYDLIIIGAGAAGLMAASEASRLGLKVLVLEGQKEPGLKILISGGGRCNVTNARLGEKDYSAGCTHTLRHVLKVFSSRDVVGFFEEAGAPLSLQETGEFFSADDKARTIRDALVRTAEARGARIECQRRVNAVVADQASFNVIGHEFLVTASKVLVTTGGLSYPATGSDGSGYRIADAFRHKIIATHPALVPLLASRDIFMNLSGIAVLVRLSLWAENRKIRSVEGPLLFTHDGFSGPAPMEMSGFWFAARAKQGCEIRVDFLPQAKEQGLLPLAGPSVGKRSVKNIMAGALPERLALVLLNEAGVDAQRFMGELARDEKKKLGMALREFPLPVKDVAGYSKAEVTSGGVDLKELKGATLESRLQEGLYFAGEVVDVDGRIGGFNLHWAFASGVAAARAAAKAVTKGNK